MKSVLSVARVVVFLLVAGVVASVVLIRWQPPPWVFLTREGLPSCPSVEAVQGGPRVPTAGSDCLAEAWAQAHGAELQVTLLTPEGDPIHSYYRVLPGRGGLEVFSDNRRDRFGTAGWEHLLCPGALPLEDLGTCQPA